MTAAPTDRDAEVLVAAARAVMAAFRLQLEAQHLPVRGAAALHLLAYALQPYEGAASLPKDATSPERNPPPPT